MKLRLKLKLGLRMLLPFTMGLIVLFAVEPNAVEAANTDVQHNVANRSIEDIKAKWLQYMPMDFGDRYMISDVIYTEQPVLTSPLSAGKLKPEYIMDGIHATNFVRYLAGLPDDIEPDWGLEHQQQAAALVNAVNNLMSHYPVKPETMDDSLYQIASNGTKSSNLYWGSPTFYDNVLGYMSDSDSSNIDRVGHRRWILNPVMKKTMFGMVYSNQTPHATMYAFNRERIASEVTYDYISWPSAGYFPKDIFESGDAWSVSLNPQKYDNNRTDEIKVSLTRVKDNKTWSFNQNDNDKLGKYLKVDTGGYGIPFSVIFRPDGLDTYNSNDIFKVHISGVYDKSGNPTEVKFETTFFNLVPTVQLHPKRDIILTKGEMLPLRYTPKVDDSNIQFVSGDSAIIKVDEKGNVTALRTGETWVTLRNHMQPDQMVYIKVVEPDKSDVVSAWAYDGYMKAKSHGIVTSLYDERYQQAITRRDFAVLAVQLSETILHKDLYDSTFEETSPFIDTSDWEIIWAYNHGIIRGTSARNFSPDNTITRQEASTLLLNLHTKLIEINGLEAEVTNIETTTKFNDDANIAGWAKLNVYKAVSLSLMKGTGNNKFTPAGPLTREQTFVILQNLFEQLVDEK